MEMGLRREMGWGSGVGLKAAGRPIHAPIAKDFNFLRIFTGSIGTKAHEKFWVK